MANVADRDLFRFDPSSPEFRAGLSMVREVLGPDKASEIEKVLTSGPLSEKLGWFFSRTWGGLYGRGEQLPLRDRAILLIGTDLALGRADPLREHLQVALHAGVTRDELVEIGFQAAFYLGVPVLPMFLRVAGDLLDNKNERGGSESKMATSLINFGTFNHTAMVVRDWRETAKNYSSLLGLKRWKAVEVTPSIMTESTYYGSRQSCSWISAFAKSGDTLIELCQPLSGKSIFDDFLRARGEGVHHVANLSHPDPQSLIAAWTDRGVPIAHYFNVGGELKIYYLDTREHLGGVYLEVVDPASFASIPGFGEDVVLD
jgi:alkylhydroperoxidase/carboxymuconolactone decarboxylase family protein YurZ/catechol 2,3-dioxygenase-like lactoylglutathione lyase family enzyme